MKIVRFLKIITLSFKNYMSQLFDCFQNSWFCTTFLELLIIMLLILASTFCQLFWSAECLSLHLDPNHAVKLSFL